MSDIKLSDRMRENGAYLLHKQNPTLRGIGAECVEAADRIEELDGEAERLRNAARSAGASLALELANATSRNSNTAPSHRRKSDGTEWVMAGSGWYDDAPQMHSIRLALLTPVSGGQAICVPGAELSEKFEEMK